MGVESAQIRSIMESEAPEIDQLTCLSYLNSFDEKYHSHLQQMDEYKPQQLAYTEWVIDKCADSLINYINIHLSSHMQLYACYEIEYVYYYLEYLYRAKIETYDTAFRRYQKVNMEKLNSIVNPNYAQMKKRRQQKGKRQLNKKQEDKEVILPPIKPTDKYIYLMNEAQRTLCLGIFELIQTFYRINKDYEHILKWDGLSDRVSSEENEDEMKGNDSHKMQRLGDESLRFSHRFSMFGYVDQPIPITYRQYRTVMYQYNKQYAALDGLFKQCQSQFDLSRKYFTSLQNDEKFQNLAAYQADYIRDGCKVAIKNRIFATQLHKTIKQQKQNNDCNIKIKHDYQIHPFYAVFSIQQITK